jgi:hypothetical protein
LDGYDVFKDTEELYDAYFINLPVSPNRVELVESHNKFDEKKVNAYEKKNKEIEEKIKRFGIKSSKILPYIKYVKKGFDMCESFDDGDEYGEYIINSALEILFKEFNNTFSRNHTKNHVNFKSLLSYLGKSPSSMSTSIDDIVDSLRHKGVLTVDKLNYVIGKYSSYLASYGNTNIFKVKTMTVSEDFLKELNINYEIDILGEFEPVPVEEPIAEVIEQEEVVEQPEPESSSEDFIWN